MFEQAQSYSPSIARLGVGSVFAVFGAWQLLAFERWIGFLPEFIMQSSVSVQTAVLLNGILDLIVGLSLLAGVCIRLFAAIGIVHLTGIILSVMWSPLVVRDIGLLLILVSVFLHGSDWLSLDWWRHSR